MMDRPRRRGLVLAVVLCVAGAALVLVAAGRTWVVEVVDRPAPLPADRTELTGGDLRPWLPALGWVALAGAGALLATRGAVRTFLGGLLALAGGAVVLGAGTAASRADGAAWPVLAVAGGLGVLVAGVLAVMRGRLWPAMGSRYERAGRGPRRPPAAPEEMWDALDRGEDPTG